MYSVNGAWSLLESRFPEFAWQFKMQDTTPNEKGFLRLKRIISGFCFVCDEEHTKGNAWINVKIGKASCFQNKDKDKWLDLNPTIPFKISKEHHQRNKGGVISREKYESVSVKPIPDDIAGIYCIKAPLGAGKTYQVTQYLRKRYNANRKLRVLYLSPRIVFASNVCSNLRDPKGASMPFVSYLDAESYDIEDPLLVLQMESLNRISEAPPYDILVLDEVKANLNQFFSNTMQFRNQKAKKFADLIYETPVVFCMDGYLDEDELKLLSKLCGPKDIFFSELTTPPSKRTSYELDTKKEFLTSLCADLEAGKNIYFCSSSKKFLDSVANEISKEGIKFQIYHQGTDDNIKRKDFANVESTWIQYQFIGTSPTTTVGVDFNVNHFHAAYLYVGRGSCVVRDMFQMLHRVRKLEENRVILYTHANKDPRVEGPPLLEKHEIFKSLKAKIKRAEYCDDVELSFESMPEWLQEYYVLHLMEKDKTQKDLNVEVKHYLALGNYEIACFRQEEETDLQLIDNRPHFDSIKNINDSQAKKLERRRNKLELSEDGKWQLAKYYFLRKLNKDNPDVAWLWQKNNLHDKIKIAYFEKNKSREELQKIDLFRGYAELSLEYRVKYDIMKILNHMLGMENSFAQGTKHFSNEELVDLWNGQTDKFRNTIKEAFDIDNVDILGGIKQEPHKQVRTILNKIYSNWTGKAKIKAGPRKQRRVNGKRIYDPHEWFPAETVFENDKKQTVRFWDLIAKEEPSEHNFTDDVEYTYP